MVAAATAVTGEERDMESGDFVWYELMTGDPVAAAEFYAAVVGWTMKDAGMPGMTYTLAQVGERQVAGLMGTPPDAGAAPSQWFGYVAVADVDTAAKAVGAAGGNAHRPPADIPGVGRFAVVADPMGAVFMLFQGEGTPAPDLPFMTPGSIGWHELHTGDHGAAFAFYGGLFGWAKGEGIDIGPMGLYQLFATSGGNPVGGMVTNPLSPPHWLFYFAVDAIDAGAERIRRAGGTVVHGPHAVPGGAWIVMATDPQGAGFALVAPGR
jgi:predicted enzyme related to lactoylglutathione lyase